MRYTGAGVANHSWCWWRVWALASASAARSKGAQSPRKKAVNLARMTGFGTRWHSVSSGGAGKQHAREEKPKLPSTRGVSLAKLGADGSGPVASRMKGSPHQTAAKHIARLQRGVIDRERVQTSQGRLPSPARAAAWGATRRKERPIQEHNTTPLANPCLMVLAIFLGEATGPTT